MQTVPSLVGTGTAVAAAAAGLAFGVPNETAFPRPPSKKRKSISDAESQKLPRSSRSVSGSALPVHSTGTAPPSSFRLPKDPQPLSSHPVSSLREARPSDSQATPPKAAGRRQSFIRYGDLTAYPIAEAPRDSTSSHGSWMKRLSMRPLSQHGSPRSSMNPDYSSFTFSNGSTAPIIPGGIPAAAPLPPNKLVKRERQSQDEPRGTLSRRGSRSHMPSLRRPATSHQRSATLQQFSYQREGQPSVPLAKFSFDQQALPRESMSRNPSDRASESPQSTSSHAWASFFHIRTTKPTTANVASSSGSPGSYSLPSRRIYPQHGSPGRAYLVTTSSVLPSSNQQSVTDGSPPRAELTTTVSSSPSGSAETPSKRARRSISMHFASPTNWISKTGSIRRPKRGSTEAKSGGKRHVSAPVGASEGSDLAEQPKLAVEELFSSFGSHGQLEPEASRSSNKKPRKRNSSSPLPPLSRLSSFNIDVSKLDAAASNATAPQRPSQTLVTSLATSQIYPNLTQNRAFSADNASTMASSDADARNFTSEDDDDTDFKSDTMFDSVRTVASSNRFRTVETPLESMFDESPPSTAGNSKTKRLSIQEILGRSWDGDTRIMEEDEGISTPIRDTYPSSPLDDDVHVDFGASTPDMTLANRDFGRLSLDDDEDDDWARDHDNDALSNHLSPPSSSLNSRGVSPQLRSALASISGNGSPEFHFDTASERPLSNLFDWSEPSVHDKLDPRGNSPRPRTVHGKQDMDIRGGRTASRKGPSAAHVRSQSVPVVPDPSDNSKPAPKFGTWGLGTKNVSEDWDDDFDFDENSVRPIGGKESTASFSMVVPASIQATQPTVKAHSGQIRELSLLVNDLKRLCRHGKDLGILDGQSMMKWREAENIITLASPDEEEEDAADEMDLDSPLASPAASFTEERFSGADFGGPLLDHTEDPFSTSDNDMIKTAVVRERQVVRRRSVFSPEDDIFGGNWPLPEETKEERPYTPDVSHDVKRNSAMISSVMEAMVQQRTISSTARDASPSKQAGNELFFDTNSLQELVKKASKLRDDLSDVVRRAELLTQSPAGTPRRERVPRAGLDSSPAFTRVFTDPASSPPKRLPKSHSTNSVLNQTAIERDSPRMQVMTVS